MELLSLLLFETLTHQNLEDSSLLHRPFTNPETTRQYGILPRPCPGCCCSWSFARQTMLHTTPLVASSPRRSFLCGIGKQHVVPSLWRAPVIILGAAMRLVRVEDGADKPITVFGVQRNPPEFIIGAHRHHEAFDEGPSRCPRSFRVAWDCKPRKRANPQETVSCDMQRARWGSNEDRFFPKHSPGQLSLILLHFSASIQMPSAQPAPN
jgi:hypothetical protein